jgi:hypothetical protein
MEPTYNSSYVTFTLFGQWPAPLGNGLLGQAISRPVDERSGLENAPCAGATRGLLGCPHGHGSYAKLLATRQRRR